MKQFLIIIFCSLTSVLFGQQMSLNTQYMFNEVSFNPGAVGSKEYISVHLNSRMQWVGFEGAPSTQSLTSHANIGKNFGLGGSINNDVSGPSRRTGLTAMAAYQLKLSKNGERKLGMGIGLSFSQHIIDMSRLSTFVHDDPAMDKGYNNQFVPDANVGFYYTYKDVAYVGISGTNLLQTKRDLFDYDDQIVNPMVRNYNLYGGYNFSLPQKWSLRPTGMIRMIDAMAIQVDITAIANYNELFWFGTSYRHQDAVAALAGFQFGAFRLGYSYDFTLSDIRKYSSGTHELFLELQIFKKSASGEKIPWLKRNRLYSTPSN